ncbi:glutathione peroxidase family protein [Vibrio maritimus]|uniref:Glutathione peroxidase n=1 Tax=Vibrio maritimus TaxID=990268 RepID=A0A090SVK9_9VIBR|nr:glutathione peroxidase family protein [Vibrio maritimus]
MSMVFKALILGLLFGLFAKETLASSCPTLLDSTQRKLNSADTVSLCDEYQGKVLLVVNTASQCGFTGQFEQLETLHNQFKEQGFSVVGFPSNDFNQDRGSEENTAKVCYLDYAVTFPMMARSSVKGTEVNPVFAEIAKQSGVTPKWNFYKYLVGRDGNVVGVFSTGTSPTDDKITAMIKQYL